MIIKNLIFRSFQDISRLSFTNAYSLVKRNGPSKMKTFSEKMHNLSDEQHDDDIKKFSKKTTGQSQSGQKSFGGGRLNNKSRIRQKLEDNPFKDEYQFSEKHLQSINQDDLKVFDLCGKHIEDKKYFEAAEDLQEILDSLEEQKAHSDALQLLELQNSLYLYSRKYMDAFIVRSNISKYMEYAPTNYQQSELQDQVVKYFYQLMFTHQLLAEVELEILYKNHYKTLSNENKALLDLSIAVGHFISPDKQAQEKGVSFILNCIKNTQSVQIQSYAFFNLGVYQYSLYEDPKKFMEQVLEHEQTKEEMKKKIQQTLSKLSKGEKINISDISNPLQNILISINLNTIHTQVYSIQDIIDNKHNLILCDKFSCKALLFLVQNYNLFNIAIGKSLRLQLMHLAYQVANQRKQHKHKANFLYASLFADMKKLEESKKLLMQNLQDTSDPVKINCQFDLFLKDIFQNKVQDSVIYQTYQLLSLVDFEHKYKYKKLAQDVIVKDQLQYWSTKVDEYELYPLHMLPKDKLKLATDEEIQQFEKYYGNQNEGEEEEDEEGSEYTDSENDSEGEDSESDIEEQYLKKWEKKYNLSEGSGMSDFAKNYYKK